LQRWAVPKSRVFAKIGGNLFEVMQNNEII